MSPALRLAACAVAAIAAGGCTDFSRFSTADGEAYCGSVTLANEFREGLSPRVRMRLELDADALDRGEPAGKLSTFEDLGDDEPPRRLLDDATLRPIAPLAHDPLSQLEFGEGRDKNAMFAVSPSDPDAATLLAIVSLESDGNVEVRLLRPGADAPAAEIPAGRRGLFGLFPLTRQNGKCGF